MTRRHLKKVPAKPPAPPRSGDKARASYPALKNDQNGRVFYILTVPVDDLVPFCEVARREDDRTEGYQRPLEPERVKSIATYLDAGQSIASSIVLSAQPEASLAYDGHRKTVTFDRLPAAFMVLDGQHRLYGYQDATTRLRVPVAIYQGLTLAEEARLFIDIDTNQKGVPQALLLDIRALAERETAREAELRGLFDALFIGQGAPLAGLGSPCAAERGRLSRVTFNRAAGPALKGSVVASLEPDGRTRAFVNYLSAVRAELIDKALFIKPTFFEAALAVMDEVLRDALLASQSVKVEDLRPHIAKIAALDVSPAAFGGARPTKGAIVTAMQAAMRRPVLVSKEALG